jgi:hypothetical protein
MRNDISIRAKEDPIMVRYYLQMIEDFNQKWESVRNEIESAFPLHTDLPPLRTEIRPKTAPIATNTSE